MSTKDRMISIVVPTLNSGETLEGCLTSIRANHTRHTYEVIVVDGGSQDGTAEIARRYADNVLVEDTYLRGVNRNKGIKSSQGDIVCFTDSDCTVPPDWIDQLAAGLLRLSGEDSKVVGVGGGNISWLEDHTLTDLAIAETIRSPLVAFGARNVTAYEDERQVFHNPPMNSAYLKWALSEVGGFGEEYNVGEDVELDLKLAKKDYKLYYLPQVLVKHRHRSSYRKFAHQMYQFGKSRIRLGRKFPEFSKRSRFGRLFHYGPLILCLMTFSPLFFIPWGMSLLNGAYMGFKERNPLLLLPVALLTVTFYISYGAGEIAYLLGRR